jgi:hypothetical protein
MSRDAAGTSACATVGVAALLICSGMLYGASQVEQGCGDVTITPKAIQMGAFYRGTAIKVEGCASNGSGVVITASGADSEERFNQKNRFGPVWINSGKVRVSQAPALFLQYSSAPLCTLLPPRVIAQERLDRSAILGQMCINPRAGAGESALRSSFVVFKELQGSYQFVDSGVKMAAPGNSATPYSLTILWPKTAPPAIYELRVYEVKQGAVIHRTVVKLPAVRVGLPAWLAQLSTGQPVYYGLAAVVTAILAGFGVDRLVTIIFGKKPRIAH